MKFSSKRLFIVSLLFAIIVTVFSFPVVNAADVQTGKFNYISVSDEVLEDEYYYSDDYFRQSGKIGNEHLLTMSYNLAISTSEIQNAEFITKIYNDIGFNDISIEDIKQKPTKDTIGTAIAHKKIGDSNVVAVTIRGRKYDSEWANNFLVGNSGNAKGFNDCSIKVNDRIKKYIQSKNLDNVKLWITGYSRAGAIADLTGVYINNNLEEFNTTADDLYIYTFEAPAASVDDAVFDNIYSVRNKNDIIPFVYPKQWGFHTNGKLINIGRDEQITVMYGIVQDYIVRDTAADEFYDDFFGWITRNLTREVYADNLEEPLSEIMGIFFGKSDEDRQKIINFLRDDFIENVMKNDENQMALLMKITPMMMHNSDYVYDNITGYIISEFEKIRDNNKIEVITDTEFESIKQDLYPIVRVLGPIINEDLFYYEGIDYDAFYAKRPELNMPDDEFGQEQGLEAGKTKGYEDGFAGEERNPEGEPSLDFGPVYLEAYKKGFSSAYNEGYELGLSHKSNLKLKGEYDGKNQGEVNGNSDAKADMGKNPLYTDYDNKENLDKWMTDEYVTAYKKAYAAAYTKAYDSYMANPVPEENEPDSQGLYHLRTLIKNIEKIISNHYPQTNLKLLQKMDDYYPVGASIQNNAFISGNQLKGNFELSTNEALEDGLVITAIYRNNQLKNVITDKTSGNKTTVEFNNIEIDGEYSVDVTVFVWDGLTWMKPLIDNRHIRVEK